jgi:8-oxo-dGTP pyrophosphatase MutT (NUDIX family)
VVSPPLKSPRCGALHLTRELVAQRLARPVPPPGAPDLHAVTLGEGVHVVHAAVLVPLVGHPEEIRILLTQRTEHLDDHPSQISFPGGRVEPSDVDREDTALREAEEEIGLSRSAVTVLGRLPDYDLPSGFRITPVVGWLEPPLTLKPDTFEVAGMFEVPLRHFLDPRNYQRRQYDFGGRRRHYMAVPYQGRYIWGATAGMLHNLCRALRD